MCVCTSENHEHTYTNKCTRMYVRIRSCVCTCVHMVAYTCVRVSIYPRMCVSRCTYLCETVSLSEYLGESVFLRSLLTGETTTRVVPRSSLSPPSGHPTGDWDRVGPTPGPCASSLPKTRREGPLVGDDSCMTFITVLCDLFEVRLMK